MKTMRRLFVAYLGIEILLPFYVLHVSLLFFLFMKNCMHREVIDCIPVLEQLCWGGGTYEIVTELSSGFNVVRLAISL